MEPTNRNSNMLSEMTESQILTNGRRATRAVGLLRDLEYNIKKVDSTNPLLKDVDVAIKGVEGILTKCPELHFTKSKLDSYRKAREQKKTNKSK